MLLRESTSWVAKISVALRRFYPFLTPDPARTSQGATPARVAVGRGEQSTDPAGRSLLISLQIGQSAALFRQVLCAYLLFRPGFHCCLNFYLIIFSPCGELFPPLGSSLCSQLTSSPSIAGDLPPSLALDPVIPSTGQPFCKRLQPMDSFQQVRGSPPVLDG